jgi:hypothetical protein
MDSAETLFHQEDAGAVIALRQLATATPTSANRCADTLEIRMILPVLFA